MSSLRTAPRAFLLAVAGGAALHAGCANGSVPDEHDALGTAEQVSCSVPTLDPTRSLFVTDATALARFPFQAVLDRIVSTASAGSQTSLQLYQQWWDTNNSAAHGRTSGPHCDDQTNLLGQGLLNGFPTVCPRQEGILAATNPFAGGRDAYTPIGLVNRFDLAPTDGADCGEYRIVYGKNSGVTPGLLPSLDRNLIIFEAVLPNPNRSAGLEGCRPVAEFWASLSANPDANDRADRLEAFYFGGAGGGLSGFEPILRWSHYAGSGAGQIRTNQFMSGRPYFTFLPLGQQWALMEYTLTKACPEAGCQLVMTRAAVKRNPFGGLFSLNLLSGPLGSPFKADFIDNQVERLIGDNLNGLSLANRDRFNAAQSSEQDLSNNYTVQLTGSLTFRGAIQRKLDELGSSLTPENIAARATTQSCAGCHQLSNGAPLGHSLTWPASNTFTQVDEKSTLSPALTGTFLPYRAEVLTAFLRSDCEPAPAAP